MCAIGMGGSVPETLAHVTRALRHEAPATRVTQIDLQAFHLRAPGTMPVPDGVHGIRLTPGDVGYRTPTRSMTVNLALSGGRLAHRRMIAAARRTLADLRADILLCCHDRFYIETAFIAAARQLGIPTVFLQEGPFCVIGHDRATAPGLRLKYALAPMARALGLTPGMPDYGLAGHDRICAASEPYKHAWIDRGVPGDRVRVTGVPRYDPLLEARERRRQRAPGRAGARPTVLVVTQPFGAHGKVDPSAAERAMAATGTALDRLAQTREVDIRIRRHPRAGADDMDALMREISGEATIEIPDRPFPARAVDVDLVVGFYSSAVLEALAIGVPSVCCRLPSDAFAEPGEAAKQDRLAELGVPMIGAPDALVTAMQAGLEDPEQTPPPSNASAELGPVDGRAGTRAARTILEIIGGEASTATGRAAHGGA